MDDQVRSYGRNAGAATQMAKPRRDPAALRTALLLAAVALLPPMGMLFAWRSRHVELRGRLILSAMAGATMTAMLTALLGGAPAAAIKPTPSVPTEYGYAAVTAAPAPVGAQAPVVAPGVTPAPGPEGGEVGGDAAPARPDAAEATQPPQIDRLDATLVYAVKSNATMYHASDICDGQVNRRVLTLREALDEVLAPCPKCNPPTADGIADGSTDGTPGA
ncbi:MAG: hypothetical protein GX558_08305 [Clostridiales bacterium]|nr:hypothetical protein [Clostridiales bacterium]